MRKRQLTTSLFALMLSLVAPGASLGQSLDDPQVVEVFLAARTFFEEIEKGSNAALWKSITAESRKKIVDTIYKEQKKTGESSTRDQIRDNFESCGSICTAFWRAYSASFDREVTLQLSRWELGFLKKNKAEILITHPRADRPAKLKLFREDGKWKVGMMESFWGRRAWRR